MNISFKINKTTSCLNVKDVLKDLLEVKEKNALLAQEEEFGVNREDVTPVQRMSFVLSEQDKDFQIKSLDEILFQKISISSLKLWKQGMMSLMTRQRQ